MKIKNYKNKQNHKEMKINNNIIKYKRKNSNWKNLYK